MIKTDWKIISMAILVIGLLLGMTFAVASVHGEEISTGGVLVYVYDEKGNPIENATVQLISNTSQIVKSGLTNKNGTVILTGMANFTGIVKVSADGYKTAQKNITYDNTKAYSFTFHMEKEYNEYIDKAKDIYNEHKTGVMIAGAVILLLLILVVLGKGKKIKW